MRILQLLTECATLFPEQYEVEKIVDRFVEVPVTREVEVPVEKIVEKNVYIEVACSGSSFAMRCPLLIRVLPLSGPG